MTTIEQAALKAARIRAVQVYGPQPGEYTPSVGDLKAAAERARKRQQAEMQDNVSSIKKWGAK